MVHGSEQSRVYPHRWQTTLQRISTVGAPQRSQSSPSQEGAGSRAFTKASAMADSTPRGDLNPSSMVHRANRNRTRPFGRSITFGGCLRVRFDSQPASPQVIA